MHAVNVFRSLSGVLKNVKSFVVMQALYTCDQVLVRALCSCVVLVRAKQGGHKGSAQSPLNQIGFKHILECSTRVSDWGLKNMF